MLHATERSIAGCQIRIYRGGNGPVLLMLHGAGGSANLLPFAERLAGRYDVLVPDHPGFGNSDLPPWLDDIHDAAYFYLDFLSALDLRDVHVVGTSLGGWIALEVAVRSVTRMRSLSLIGAAGINCPTVRRGDIFMWSPEIRIRKLIHDQTLAAKVIANKSNFEQESIAVKNEFTTARLAWQPRFFNPSLHKWLHRIAVRTQVIWGDHDAVFPLPYAETLARGIPGARLHVIQSCGHLPHVEQPDQLAALITQFADGLGVEGGAS